MTTKRVACAMLPMFVLVAGGQGCSGSSGATNAPGASSPSSSSSGSGSSSSGSGSSSSGSGSSSSGSGSSSSGSGSSSSGSGSSSSGSGSSSSGSSSSGSSSSGSSSSGSSSSGSMVTSAPDAGAPDAGPPNTLRAAGAAAKRFVGAAVSASKLSNPSYAAVAAREFDYVTPENEAKFAALEPTQGQFTYTTVEPIFTFATTNGMKVKGHNLLWHQAVPSWLPLLGPQGIHDAVVNHATQVVTHFKGRVVAWDVINEVIDDTATAAEAMNPITALRVGDATTYPLYYNLGTTNTERQTNLYALIKDVFAAARAADPNALLFYNDYGIEAAGPKADAAYALAAKLKADGVAIQGVGFQSHDGLTSPTAAEFAANLQRMATQGFVVNISELDIDECGAAAGQGNTEQATQWHAIAAVCVAQAACNGITTWGIDDADSWKTLDPTFHSTTGDPLPYPLMFDSAFAPKPSYMAMLNALLGK